MQPPVLLQIEHFEENIKPNLSESKAAIIEIDPNWSPPIFKKNAKYLINKLTQKSRIEITRLQKSVNIKYD